MRRGAGAGDAEKSSSSGAAGGAGGATGISSKGLSADSVLRNIDEEPPSARAAHGDPLFPKVRRRLRCCDASPSKTMLLTTRKAESMRLHHSRQELQHLYAAGRGVRASRR